jgi:glycosyltransferase involved in cell wall biosynthesis/protein-tyrosine-phosphatase
MSTSALKLPDGVAPRTMRAARQLRVCHIMSADLWAGAEVQLATTAAHLVNESGVSVSAVLLNEGQLAANLRRLGVPVTILDETRINSLKILIGLVRILREQRIDLVHTHRYKDTVLGLIAGRIAGVPYAVRTMHGLTEPMRGWAYLRFALYKALEKLALRCCADQVIAVSKDMAGILRRSGYPADRITHIHNGIDVREVRALRRRQDVRGELGVDAKTYLIGAVGRLSPVKGHSSFLRAARLVLHKQPRAKFLIVGDGPLRAELQAMAADLRIDGACLFAGHRTDVHDLLSAMNVFVLPSLSEGIPMALLEAMALGTPVVATSVGGVPEVISHRMNGLLVRSGDERALADACTALTLDCDLAEQLAANARRTVEQAFSCRRSGQALTDVYKEVASARTAGDPAVLAKQVKRLPPRGFVPQLLRALTGRLVHRIACARGRRRMTHIRRHPAALNGIARSARSVLVVCHGNIIRSAFAERLLRRALGTRALPTIGSAGLYAIPGNPPHQNALVTAMSRSLDLSGHVASPLSGERVAASDLILVMDVWQLVELVRRFPEARDKTFLFTCFAPDVPLEVEDPIYGDRAMFEACFDHIVRAASPLVHAITANDLA